MAWSPDGAQIAFSADRHGHVGLYSKQWGGAGEERLLLEDGWRNYPQFMVAGRTIPRLPTGGREERDQESNLDSAAVR